ncbi:MAG: exodeoxyribonuclease V subunit alpha [Gracilimonas sp.]|uniref:exodeoxyribonuclease V subunit alpha n=1 Tax=Gracilimonas sp. TaxID=1974203 RepID=UPI0019AAF4CD|nr:exodeoxyribonuclease V subunit alpha [Gracilimonas sp.]MBD3615833.1 exodeoxyribonuclease V subunit alpha [Gracilimonas sp.]
MNVLNYLETLRSQEIIGLLEVEYVRFLLEIQPDEKEEVLLAAAACIQAQQNGNVCLDIQAWDHAYLFEDPKSEIKITGALKQSWLDALLKSRLVSTGDELKPLVVEDKRLYLHRFWKYEEELSEWLKNKSEKLYPESNEVKSILQNILQPSSDLFEVNWQHVAVCLSFLKDLLVISGGPGTGKTFTVLNIIAVHAMVHSNKELRIALAAPTGKAARRLAESIESGKENLPESILSGIVIPDTALTVHKLLGSDFKGSRFKYNEENKLPYDIVVIDEASMLDITMWVRLIRAIGDDTKLVVLGDKDQLASVEAGSILGDLCQGENSFSEKVAATINEMSGIPVPVVKSKPSINDSVVFLTKSYRFGTDSGIGQFALAVNNADAEKAIRLLKDSRYPNLNWVDSSSEPLQEIIQKFAVDHYQYYSGEEENKRLISSNRKKILCALRRGRSGVEQINREAERLIRRKKGILNSTEWYDGRIVMATRNDSILKIRNGEIGICKYKEEPAIKFEGEYAKEISATRLKEYEPAYAITIHKSQGSEFDEVAIILPSKVNSILSKEILYTAVTRARQNTLIIANEEIIRKTIQQSVSRNSGLRQKVWEDIA